MEWSISRQRKQHNGIATSRTDPPSSDALITAPLMKDKQKSTSIVVDSLVDNKTGGLLVDIPGYSINTTYLSGP